MEELRREDAELKVSARIDRAKRSTVSRPGTLRERAKFVTDIVVEDLSRSGCRIRTDAQIDLGALISIGIPGVGMQAARVVRSEGDVHGCSFLLAISEHDVQQARTAVTVENVSFPKLRERVRAEAEVKHNRRSTDGIIPWLFRRMLSRFG